MSSGLVAIGPTAFSAKQNTACKFWVNPCSSKIWDLLVNNHLHNRHTHTPPPPHTHTSHTYTHAHTHTPQTHTHTYTHTSDTYTHPWWRKISFKAHSAHSPAWLQRKMPPRCPQHLHSPSSYLAWKSGSNKEGHRGKEEGEGKGVTKGR